MATNRIPENHWLRTKPIAHRGYWGGDVPENSRAAYERAAEKGYPIEIDVYLTKDEKIVSFHDGTLKRMTGRGSVDRKVRYVTIPTKSCSNSGWEIRRRPFPFCPKFWRSRKGGPPC